MKRLRRYLLLVPTSKTMSESTSKIPDNASSKADVEKNPGPSDDDPNLLNHEHIPANSSTTADIEKNPGPTHVLKNFPENRKDIAEGYFFQYTLIGPKSETRNRFNIKGLLFN